MMQTQVIFLELDILYMSDQNLIYRMSPPPPTPYLGVRGVCVGGVGR